MDFPTGEQYEINAGSYSAVITEVGARLRSLTFDGTELLATHGPDQAPKGWEGAHLFPWPNRLRDGRYRLSGQEFQLPINEPARNNANHGLNVGLAWKSLAHFGDSVRQRVVLWPRRGWPGILAVEILHQLGAGGLRVEVTATNIGTSPAPWGYGAHPYFRFDDISNVKLTVPFDAELTVDPDRRLPIRLGPVTPAHDFLQPRTIGTTVLDTAFTDPLTRDWVISLSGDGRTIDVWGEATTQWAQVFTAPHRDSVAVEPMTCGPDAFNEGPTYRDRIMLRPGDSANAVWGVRAHGHTQ